MPFCKKCSSILMVKKSEEIIEFKELPKNDLLNFYVKRLESLRENLPLTKNAITISWNKTEIDNILSKTKDEFFTSLNKTREEVKEELLKLHHKLSIKNNLINYVHFCNDCGISYYLEPGTIISSRDYKINVINNDEVPEIRKTDPTLMRTKDYICPNKDCINNKDKSEKVQKAKEANMYKLRDNQIIYICTQCNLKWGT